jgi:MFS family permease
MGIALAAAPFSPESIFVWVLSAAGLSIGLSGGCCWTVTQTLAGPRAAGRWAGVQNFVGNFAGGVGPILTGYLVGRTGQFYWPFVIAAVISCIGALGWVFAVGPIEPVDWEKKLRRLPFRVDAAPATGAMRP